MYFVNENYIPKCLYNYLGNLDIKGKKSIYYYSYNFFIQIIVCRDTVSSPSSGREYFSPQPLVIIRWEIPSEGHGVVVGGCCASWFSSSRGWLSHSTRGL